MPQDDKGKQFYDFVASKGIKVPPTYDEFAQSMRDTAIAEKFHGYVQSQDIKVPELNTFISTFSPSEPVKKKDQPEPLRFQTGSQNLQATQARQSNDGPLEGLGARPVTGIEAPIPPTPTSNIAAPQIAPEMDATEQLTEQQVRESMPVDVVATAVEKPVTPTLDGKVKRTSYQD